MCRIRAALQVYMYHVYVCTGKCSVIHVIIGTSYVPNMGTIIRSRADPLQTSYLLLWWWNTGIKKWTYSRQLPVYDIACVCLQSLSLSWDISLTAALFLEKASIATICSNLTCYMHQCGQNIKISSSTLFMQTRWQGTYMYKKITMTHWCPTLTWALQNTAVYYTGEKLN